MKRAGEEMHSADEMRSAYPTLKHSAYPTLKSLEEVEKGKVPLSA